MRPRLAAAAVIFLACGPRVALPGEVARGRWVRYYAWPDEGPPCQAAIDEIDAFVDQLGAFVRRPPPESFQVDYYKLHTAAEVMAACNEPRAAGCAVGSTVYSTEWTHDHEVTHAFFSRLGLPPQLFMEATATVFGCGPARYSGGERAKVDLAPLVDNAAWRATEWNYASAASFVRSLIAAHGIDAFVGFYEQAPRDQPEGAFAAAFGGGLSEALAAWFAGPPLHDGDYCLPLADLCDAPPALAAGTLTVPLTCAGSTLSFQGTSHLRLTGDAEGQRVEVRACDAPAIALFTFGDGSSTALASGRTFDLWAPLEGRRYRVDVTGAAGSVTLSAANDRLDPGTCDGGGLAIADDSWDTMLRGLDVPDGGLLRLLPASRRRISRLRARGFSDSPLLCAGCADAGSACTAFLPSGETAGGLFGSGGPPAYLAGASSLWLPPTVDGGSVELVLEPAGTL